MDEWDWRRTLDVILTGTFAVTQSVGRVMKLQRSGLIINIGPTAMEEKEPLAAYSAAKAGVMAFSESVAQELDGYGIQVVGLIGSDAHVENILQLISRYQVGT